MTLAAREVSVRRSKTLVLDKASFTLQPGRLTAIVGPNGAGKSTALAALSGALRLSGGGVFLDGRPVARMAAPALARRRAVLTQDTAAAFPFLAAEIVAMGRAPHEPRANPGIVEAAMEETSVAHLARRNVLTLSGGERQRVFLAKALAQVWGLTNGWLLLDEPIAALDPAHQIGVLELLKTQAGRGTGVVAVLHDLELAAAYADDALALKDGKVFCACSPSALLSPGLLAAVFGVRPDWRRPAQGDTCALTTRASRSKPP
jgi:iron complex transport system ATP-binding protein